MTKQDIRKMYTRKVTELLSQGYDIYPETMGGSQGEIAHIDLSNGSEILRVLLEKDSAYDDNYGDTVRIAVGRCTDRLHGNWQTIWNEHLEILSEIKLAQIREDFYTTMEAGKRMAAIRHERWRRHLADRPQDMGDACKSVGLRWLRKQPRMKTCQLSDIERMTRTQRPDGRIGYEIRAKGKCYSLHA